MKSQDVTADGLAFIRLVSQLAARLANAPSDKLDVAICQGLGQLSEAMGIDHCALWEYAKSTSDSHVSVRWTRPGCEAAPLESPLRQVLSSMSSELRTRGAQWLDDPDDVSDSRDRETLRRSSALSIALIPLTVGGCLVGVLSLVAMREPRAWEPLSRIRLRLVSNVLALALASRMTLARTDVLPPEADRSARLASVGLGLPREPLAVMGRPHIACESAAARDVLEQIDSVAPTLATVLLTGETGTGKEVFAQAIHDRSPRRDRPMVRVNCAAIPAALIESELFGRERGAYTGALSRQIGRFELADGGTLFLDEIGDLPLESQVKLLRAIQERVVERLGGTDPIRVDVRLIAATNRDLEAAVAARTFREDLYYRLNVFPIQVPPLRERLQDIPVLVWSFIDEFARASGKRIESVAPESLAGLQRYAWPGNVRELKNLVERAVILATGPRLVVALPHGPHAHRESPGTLADLQTSHIRRVLEQAGWRVRGPGGAAEVLGMKPTTLDSRMARLGIRRPG